MVTHQPGFNPSLRDPTESPTGRQARKEDVMAKTSILNRQKKREKLVRQYATKRAELKRRAKDPALRPEERMLALEKLAKLPRNSSPVRLVSRCMVSGRGRGVYRKFRLSRIAFRELAHAGQLPGVHKSSW